MIREKYLGIKTILLGTAQKELESAVKYPVYIKK